MLFISYCSGKLAPLLLQLEFGSDGRAFVVVKREYIKYVINIIITI